MHLKFIGKKIFELTHNQIYHEEFYRTYDYIVSSIYVRQLLRKFRDYIAYCSQCQLNQTKKHFIYKKLNSIIIFSISFHIIAMN